MTTADRALQFWRAVAYHEAGHCVAAVQVHVPVERVVLDPADDHGAGVCHLDVLGPWRRDLARHLTEGYVHAHVMVRLAGPVAEQRLTGRWNAAAARDDLAQATDLLTPITFPGELKGLLAKLAGRVGRMLSVWSTWTAVEAIAAELLKVGELTGAEVADIHRHATCIEERVLRSVER